MGKIGVNLNPELAQRLKELVSPDQDMPSQIYTNVDEQNRVILIQEYEDKFYVSPLDWKTAVFVAHCLRLATLTALKNSGIDYDDCINQIREYERELWDRTYSAAESGEAK